MKRTIVTAILLLNIVTLFAQKKTSIQGQIQNPENLRLSYYLKGILIP